jgi:Protein of unknown function (DUF3108)
LGAQEISGLQSLQKRLRRKNTNGLYPDPMQISMSPAIRSISAFCLGAFVTLSSMPAGAEETEVSSAYDFQLAGIPFAEAKFVTTRSDNLYNVTIDFQSTGLGEIVNDLTAELVSTGIIGNTGLQSQRYYLQYRKGKRHRLFETTYKDGDVTDTRVEPPREMARRKNWVAVEPDDLKAVTDPIAALMAPSVTDPCRSATAVFDGETRYDVFLERRESKPFETGNFKGDVIVCGMRYVPRAGFREGKSDAEFIRRLKTMEIWFAKSDRLRLYAPVYFSVPTSFGKLTMKASRFGG